MQRCTAQLPTHHIPPRVVWAISLLIPPSVAVVNYFMVLGDMHLLHIKFETAQRAMTDGGIFYGVFALTGISVCLCAVAVCLVKFVAPACAGSGIPEVLGFLNGSHMPRLFTVQSLFVRSVAIVLAQAAGFPIGREGPMVAIGGCIGFGIAYVLMQQYERQSDKVIPVTNEGDGETNLQSSALIVNEERFAFVRRMGCALGGAAGVATAFNAPIGGILYMFEEMSVSSLPPQLERFTCTVFSALMARALLNVTNMDFHQLVVYDNNIVNSHGVWDWIDVPLFIILAAGLGAFGALFSRVLLKTFSWRQRRVRALHRRQSWVVCIECLLYCAICVLVFGLVPMLVGCISDDRDVAHGAMEVGTSQHRRLSDKSPSYVRYTCPEGEHNEVASLLLSGAEGAIKHLYSRSAGIESLGPLILTLVIYTMLAAGMPGLSVPMGTFVPCMLIGALAGRIMGEAAAELSRAGGLGGATFAPPGVYAVVGSAAVLTGFTHMTIGIMILVEAVNDLGVVTPLMLAVFVAHTSSTSLISLGYDEELIVKKSVPFLEAHPPREMEAPGLTAADFCDTLPDDAILPPQASLCAIKCALMQPTVTYFPIIVEGGSCIGLTTRGRLKAVLSAVRGESSSTTNHRRHRCASSFSNDSESTQSGSSRRRWRNRYRTGTNSSESSDVESEASPITPYSPQLPLGPECLNVAPTTGPNPNRRLSGCESLTSSGGVTLSCKRNSIGHLSDMQTEIKIRSLIKFMFAPKTHDGASNDNDTKGDELLPLHRIMDPAPYTVLEDMTVSRFYPLFNKAGANVACVVSRTGAFRGVLTRKGISDAAGKLHAAENAQGHSKGQFPPLEHSVDSRVDGRDGPRETPDSDWDDNCSTGSESHQSLPSSVIRYRVQQPDNHVTSTSACNKASVPTAGFASSVLANLSHAGLQAQLTEAWARIASCEKERDELLDELGRTQQQCRDFSDRIAVAGLCCQSPRDQPMVDDTAAEQVGSGGSQCAVLSSVLAASNQGICERSVLDDGSGRELPEKPDAAGPEGIALIVHPLPLEPAVEGTGEDHAQGAGSVE